MRLKRGLKSVSWRHQLAKALGGYLRVAKMTALISVGGFAMGFVMYLALVHLSPLSPIAAVKEALSCPGCEVARAVDPTAAVDEARDSRRRSGGADAVQDLDRRAGRDGEEPAAPRSGSPFDRDLLVLVALALAAVAAIVLAAPRLASGVRRLNLLHNVLGIVIVSSVATGGIILLVWGLAAGSKELIYLALLSLIVAGLCYRAFARGHRTWLGLLGFNDDWERTRSFLEETRDLWRSVLGGAAPAGSEVGAGVVAVARARAADPDVSARHHHAACAAAASDSQAKAADGDDAAPPAAPSPSALLGAGQIDTGGPAGRLMERAVRFAAHRLTDRRVSVFPDMLRLEIALAPARGEGPAFAGGRRPQISVRRDTGAPLMVSARTDLTFLELTLGRRLRDGSYPIEIGLVAHRLEAGPFAGMIEIATGDSFEPRVVVPVAGTVS